MKRKRNVSSKEDKEIEPPKKKHRKRERKIDSLSELISFGKKCTVDSTMSINVVVLWQMLNQLEKLNNMIGMKSLKETVFDQIIYYLQGMHLRNLEGEFLHTLILGPPGHGKCLGYNVPIMLFNGRQKMSQDIKTGDLLMGDDSSPRQVLSVCRGRENLYRVKQLYGDDYIVNESHILSLKLSRTPQLSDYTNRESYEVKWFDETTSRTKCFPYKDRDKGNVYQQAQYFKSSLAGCGTVRDICVSDYIKRSKSWKRAHKGYKVGIDFIERKVPVGPYLLGLWLGDGSRDRFRISLGGEIELKEYMSGLDFYISDKSWETKNEMYNIFLFNYGLVEGNKHIPDVYKFNNRDVRLELLAGIIDSDGHLRNKCYDIMQRNYRLSQDIVWLARSVGLKANMNTFVKKQTFHRIVISGNTHEIPCLLLRKRTESCGRASNSLVCGIEIEDLGLGSYYGFTIDGNHRFLLGDFTVTHNTEVAKIIGEIYCALGILSKGSFRIIHRDDLVAKYLGQSAPKTRKLLKKCLGGVAFIDEIYSLAPDPRDSDSFSKESIDVLNAFLSEHKNDFCCIAAGYEKEVEECFFSMNKGLKRRFVWVHRISSYSHSELADIFMKMIGEIKWKYNFSKNDVVKIFKNNKKLFPNAGGDIETFVTKCKIAHSLRVFTLPGKYKFILTLKDLYKGIEMVKKFLPKKQDLPMMYT